MRGWTTLFACALLCGCGDQFSDDYNLIDRMRVLGAKSEPAEAAPGSRVTLTAFVVGASGAVNIDWAACIEPPIAGSATINPQCIERDTAPFLVPLGSGSMLDAQLPAFDPGIFGDPDITGGVYVPVRFRSSSGGVSVDSILRLRIAGMGAPNHNPRIESILVGGATPLDASSPFPVDARGAVTLRAHFADGSAESYGAFDADGGVQSVTELLEVTWFATAGHFSDGTVSADSDSTLSLDRNPPRPGSLVDVYAVGRDERGGLDLMHRTLVAK
jgi:hypothetical protein